MIATVAVDERISVGQAARVLGISAMQVRRLIDAGKLPATLTNLGHLIERNDVEQLAQERAERTSETPSR